MFLRAGAVLLACLLPRLLEVCFQKTFKVHSSGSVLITGASTGIGKHACLGLAKSHPEFTLYCGVRKEKDGDWLVSEAQGAGNMRYIILDTTREDHIEAAAEKLRGEGLIGLVNNAGVALSPKAVEFSKMDDFRWLFDVNFFGVLRLTQVLLPELRKNQGRIVVTSSIAGVTPGSPFNAAYHASKQSMDSAFNSVRQEVEPHGVSVSILCPACVKAEILNTANARADETDPLSEEHKVLYPAMAKFTEGVVNQCAAMADEPTVTTDAIEHALTSEHPKTHYVVANFMGIPSWLVVRVVWMLPHRVLDLLLTL